MSVWVVARLPQRLKSTFLKFFLHSRSCSGLLHSKKFQKTLILAFEANSILSCQNRLFSRFLAHCEILWIIFIIDDQKVEKVCACLYYQAKHTFMILVMSVSRVKPAFAKGLEHKVSLYSITQIPMYEAFSSNTPQQWSGKQ